MGCFIFNASKLQNTEATFSTHRELPFGNFIDEQDRESIRGDRFQSVLRRRSRSQETFCVNDKQPLFKISKPPRANPKYGLRSKKQFGHCKFSLQQHAYLALLSYDTNLIVPSGEFGNYLVTSSIQKVKSALMCNLKK